MDDYVLQTDHSNISVSLIKENWVKMYEPASCSLNDRKINGNEDLFDFPLFFPFHWAISCKFLELF